MLPHERCNLILISSLQANFLRTYFPDIEIPAELIRDEVETDARTTQDLEGFDPFSGNLLESIQLQDGGSYLCFPMGESKRELSENFAPCDHTESPPDLIRYFTLCTIAKRRCDF